MTAGGIVGEYQSLKREVAADLLAMQVGDFYEFFCEDAEVVAREIDLTLTEKGSAGEQHPMAGVPVAELDAHVAQLVERGYRVAVAPQHETADGHARSVERVVTPGTTLATTAAEARYLVAVVGGPDGFGLAFADVTTGAFHVTAVPDQTAIAGECARFDPVEVLPGPELRDDELATTIADRTDATVTTYDEEAFAPGAATHEVRTQFGDGIFESVGLAPESPAVRAAGAVLAYIEATGTGVRSSFTRLGTYDSAEGVALDATTQRNLELTEAMAGDESATLRETVDHTTTAAGRRILTEWLTRPRRDRQELQRRLDGVVALTDSPLAREALRDRLAETRDLARLASRAAGGTATPRDLAAVRDTLASLPDLRAAIDRAPGIADSPVAGILDRVDDQAAKQLRTDLEAALVDEPPNTASEGGIFRRGYDDELDELIERHESLQTYFDELGERERNRLGVTHLQIGRNQTDGYYIQIGKSEADAAPDEYREIKTLKNSKRFETEELVEKERAIVDVEQRREGLERERFDALRDRIGGKAALLQSIGQALAELDVMGSHAVHAVENDWTRPTLHDGDGIDVTGGRHPVVEQTVEFVPNDALLGVRSEENTDPPRFLIVTGPNMAGKSTYMRQVALIVLLAQSGSFVPAERARIGLVDGIYTRVGALDELAGGRSTFMVEMQELSRILHAATADSLVILDEVGRGTATYDGISIAWAATEYLHNEVGSLTLFATHYHELTGLAEHLPRVANVHVAAEESDGEVTFLRTVVPGAADRSYGVHVADLAGVPHPVVDRAGEVLERLRSEQAIEARGGETGTETVQAVFDLGAGEYHGGASADGAGGLDDAAEAVLDNLRTTPVEELSPVEALNRVADWQRQLEDPGE